MAMTLKDAVAIGESRNGKPHEDDWELAEAAAVMSRYITQIANGSERAELERYRKKDRAGGVSHD